MILRATDKDCVAGRCRIALALVVIIVLTGATVATAGTLTTREPNAHDQALAWKGVAHLSDFDRSLWKKAPKSAVWSADDDRCSWRAFGAEERIVTGWANSAFLSETQYTQFYASAEVTKTLYMARRDATLLGSGAVMQCVRAQIQEALPNGRLMSVKRVTFPQIGEWRRAYRAFYDAGGSKDNSWYLDLVLLRVGRVEITILGVAPAVPSLQVTAFEASLAKKLVCRCMKSEGTSESTTSA